MFYLENSQVADAFQPERLEVLKVIASQADISLENSRIYGELDDLNKNLEHKVEERTQELAEKNRELEILSTTDQLTGLYNRRFIETSAKEEIQRSQRYGSSLSAILLDIDHFKAVNDTHGHDVGDEILVSIVATISKNTRQNDMPSRWGGEEFLILAPGIGDQGCADLAEKLRKAIESSKHGPLDNITASFGFTCMVQVIPWII